MVLLFVPRGVHGVVVRYLAVDFLCLRRVGLLDELGRHAAPNLVLAYLCALQHKCSGSHNSAFAHMHAVEQCATHADESIVVNVGTVDGNVVAHGDVVAKGDCGFLIEGVQYRTVLYVAVTAYANPVDPILFNISIL